VQDSGDSGDGNNGGEGTNDEEVTSCKRKKKKLKTRNVESTAEETEGRSKRKGKQKAVVDELVNEEDSTEPEIETVQIGGDEEEQGSEEEVSSMYFSIRTLFDSPGCVDRTSMSTRLERLQRWSRSSRTPRATS